MAKDGNERVRDDAGPAALSGAEATGRASGDCGSALVGTAAGGQDSSRSTSSSGEETPDRWHGFGLDIAIPDPQVREVAERQLWALAFLDERGVPAAWLDATDERGAQCRRLLTEAGILEVISDPDRAGQDARDGAAADDPSAPGAQPLPDSSRRATSQAEAAMVRLDEARARAIRADARCRGRESHAVAAVLDVLARANPERVVGFYDQRARTRELIGQLAAITAQEHSSPLVRPHLVPIVCGTLDLAVKVHVAGEAAALEPLAVRLAATVDPASPTAIALRDELAGLFASLGAADRATHVFEDHLSRTDAAYGPDHPATLASRNALAYFRGSVGDLAGAIALYEQVLSGRQHVLGPDDPLTIASLNNLAYAYGAIGEPGRAIPLCEQVAADTERTSGPSHPDTLLSLNNLAYAYEAAGRVEDALSVARRAHADCLAALGPDHRITRNIAHLLDSLG
ncbi:MAG: tetratricopeptide repeat protein [Actinomycetaceae bacterium]|nr:tetratricopeptide repeat protein [Actinomycetaceae bacterium]